MNEPRMVKMPGDDGLKCGDCHAVLGQVNRTIKTPGFLTRERICLNCGKVNTTSERVINTRERRHYFSSPCE